MPLHFHDEDWARIERDYARWWAHDLERPLVLAAGHEYQAGRTYAETKKFDSNYPFSMSAEEVIARVGQHLEATRFHGDAYPRWFVNFGPGIVAGFLGTVVHSVEETVWFEPQQVLPPDQLHPVYDAGNVWWQRVRDLTRCAVATWGKQVQVSHADLGGNLDVVASLRTTQALLTDLLDAPEEVDRLVHEVTTLWLRYYDELDALIHPGCRGRAPWAPIWSTETTYMFQSDFAYMISPAMFDRYVVPDLVACCEHIENGFYHLDGKGQIPHLDMLLAIPRLRGIQWIPGDGAPPPDQWLWLLKRIVDGGKLCQVYVTAEGARTIVKNLGGKGFMLAVSDEMTAEEAAAFLKVLAREDIARG